MTLVHTYKVNSRMQYLPIENAIFTLKGIWTSTQVTLANMKLSRCYGFRIQPFVAVIHTLGYKIYQWLWLLKQCLCGVPNALMILALTLRVETKKFSLMVGKSQYLPFLTLPLPSSLPQSYQYSNHNQQTIGRVSVGHQQQHKQAHHHNRIFITHTPHPRPHLPHRVTTALHCAASRGHLDCLDCLVTLCGAEVDTLDSNGCTPLFYAVTLGHADCTQLLLHHGAHTDRQDRKGRT